MKPNELTILDAQIFQPWAVPYSPGVVHAEENDVPHILASHAVLHAAKSVGKLAAVFEAMDHRPSGLMNGAEFEVVKGMSADLMTVALRMANLHGFSLAEELVRRVEEKNGVNILASRPQPNPQTSGNSEGI